MVASTASSSMTAPVTSTATMLRRSLAALHGLAAVAAGVGGISLISQPSGASLGLSPAELSGFTSFAIPGVLLVILAWLQLGAAFLVLKPGAHGLVASQAGGALLVFFVAFQSALVLPLHPLQLVGLLAGALVYCVAHELHHDEPHTPLLP